MSEQLASQDLHAAASPSSEPQPIHHLLVIQDLRGQRTISLDAATYSLGRDLSNSIVLHSKSVSRQHAILLRVTTPKADNHLFRIVDGNLRGKHSRNGLFVNGNRCFSHDLQHGDTVSFGANTCARYYAFSDLADLELVEACQFENPELLTNSAISPFETIVDTEVALGAFNDTALARLASFPELTPTPIIEADLSGTVTYVNPAALSRFPNLWEAGLQHPVLVGLVSAVQDQGIKFFTREITVEREIFEQSVHYIPESDLIRTYLADITERKRTEVALLSAEQKYRSIFENAVEGIFQTTPDGRYITANPMLARIYGYDSPEALITTITDLDHQLYVNPQRRSEFIRRIQERGTVWGFESQVYRQDGNIIWISENARAIRGENGQLLGFEGSVEDITAQKHATEELRKRDRLLQAVAEATNTLLAEMDFETGITYALATVGLAAKVDRAYIYENHPHPVTQEVEMSMRYEWVGGSVKPSIDQPHWQNQPYSEQGLLRWYQALSTGQALYGITREFPRAEQDILQLDDIKSILMVPILIGDEFWGYLGFDDCSTERQWSRSEESILFTLAASVSSALQRQRTEQIIRYRAFHDLLTGLPNRALFNEQLAAALNEATQNGETLAVMFLDLDRFKTINDTLGHNVGDELLKAVAHRLSGALCEKHTVARWGGDEFTILLPCITQVSEVAQIAGQTLKAIETAFEIEHHELYVAASIGIALFRRDGYDADTLIKNADIALYQAKETGGNAYQFYTAAMSAKTPELLTLEKSLRHALDRDEFLVLYQPKVDVATGQITGMETLLRWQHPEMGILSPKLFIPIAEESGLIIPIGEWVLRQACQQARAWQEAGLPPIAIAVNLSARQFHQPKLVETVARILRETDLDPHYLELEITETTAIQNVKYTATILQELQAMGVCLAIDDFGTGYTSLSHLQQLPLNSLKIDQSFVRNLAENGKDSHIITAIVALAKGLGLRVVAEGVEHQGQLDFLQSIACQEVQGFLLYKPLSTEGATAALAAKHLSWQQSIP